LNILLRSHVKFRLGPPSADILHLILLEAAFLILGALVLLSG
jgi:hypothetical protein